MGVEELLGIAIDCKRILVGIGKGKEYDQLIERIDQQVDLYKKDYRLGRLFCPDNFLAKKERSESKKRIFEDSSCEKSPTKSNKMRQSFLHDSSLTSLADQSLQQSKVQQIFLNNIASRFANHQSESTPDKFQSLQGSINREEQRVNTSLDAQTSFQSMVDKEQCIKECKNVKEELKDVMGQKEDGLVVEDFFVIDFNFETNEYEILPKREHFGSQPRLLVKNQLIDSQSSISKTHSTSKNNPKQPAVNMVQLSKQSSHSEKRAVYPFAQIAFHSPKNTHLPHISSLRQYSMEAQVSETGSRIIGLEKQLEVDSHQIQGQNVQQIYQMREVIMNLLTHSGSAHVTQIKPTSSMTQLLKMTTNPSTKNRTLEHIVMPSFLQMRHTPTNHCNKYTHIIKSYQCVSWGLKYYECQRLYVIVERGKRYGEVENVVRQLVRKAFQLRVKVDGGVGNVKAESVKRYISEIALIPRAVLEQYARNAYSGDSPRKGSSKQLQGTYCINPSIASSSPLSQVSLYCQSAVNIKFLIQTPPNSETKSFNLVLILMYFLVFEYKIIFLTTKGYETTVSQLLNAIVHMIGDLRYIYPVILAVLTNHHIEFVNAPIPGIVALWGKEARYKKAVEFMRRKLKEEASQAMDSSSSSSQSNSPTTIVVDMNKHEFVDHTFTHRQLFVIENLHNYTKNQLTRTNSKTLFTVMNDLFNQQLLKQPNTQSQAKPKWMQMLSERLLQSQMYEEFMKYQEGLGKQNA